MGRARPARTRHSVYQSLNENQLSTRLEDFSSSPKKIRNRKHTPETEHSYSLRRGRATEYVNEGANYSDEEEDDSLTPLRQKTAKRRKIQSEDDDEFVEEKIKNEKAKRVQEDNEDEISLKPTPRRSTRFQKNEFDCSERPLTDANEKENEDVEDFPSSRKRGRPRTVTIESKPDDDEEEDEKEGRDEESRESTVEPRQYQLREKRTPVDRLSSHMDRPRRKAAPAMFSRQRFVNNGNRRNLREKRKRRYSSSSTSSSDEELTNAKRDAKDEAKFQRRVMRSMHQSRQNLLPINMTDKDLSGSKHLIKERLRQVGQVGGNSCTDIDPMGIDKSVGFDQVGGLTSHLQSLKETVLF
uniref:Uncharacterized protein n=1 Tax=Panagrolaimus sp. ES5 TaxID=591445 RepID=A0AC34GBK6_9BILA